MANSYCIITLLVLLSSSMVFSQNFEAYVFEPESVDINIINNHHPDLLLNIFLRDRRVSGNLYQKEIYSTIKNQFQKSFPKTKITFMENIRDINTAEKNQILVIIDVIDYFVGKKSNKWIGKSTFDLKIFDYRKDDVQEMSKQITYTATKPDRQSLQSPKQALTASFKKALTETINFTINSISEDKKFESANNKY
ncbi:MAG TPA: hypothetical protein VK982_02620 [Bacteroidales bacterium]|nr:hypothetical protein [Bacteroidales bacterium]